MSKKLLQRPPFRFLFDVVMELNNKHSFLEGLYTTEETANIKEKADKIAFLQKVTFAKQCSSEYTFVFQIVWYLFVDLSFGITLVGSSSILLLVPKQGVCYLNVHIL